MPDITVDEFVNAKIAPQFHDVVAMLRALMSELAPDALESVRYSMPTWKLKYDIAYILPAKKNITFGFPQGILIQDRYGLLKGTAKWARHVKLARPEDANMEALRDYVRQAIALDERG